MGCRLWLEWGEFSLVEHTNVVVIVGYPSITALIITLIYAFRKVQGEKARHCGQGIEVSTKSY